METAPLFFLLLLLLFACKPRQLGGAAAARSPDPAPTPWPEQFHALVYMNMTATGRLVIDDLWYDWPNGRNFNILQRQLSDVLYDLEWDNGTSFYYTLGPLGTCRPRHFPVGILRPDFLDGSTYLGRASTDGFLCDLWTKLDFIWYYESVASKRPVRWDFFDGISMHVMTFEEGVVLDDPHWQAPPYCFGETGGGGFLPADEGGRDLRVFADAHRRLSYLNPGRSFPDHLLQSKHSSALPRM